MFHILYLCIYIHHIYANININGKYIQSHRHLCASFMLGPFLGNLFAISYASMPSNTCVLVVPARNEYCARLPHTANTHILFYRRDV